MKPEDMSRQRLDFRTGPKGETIGILTVALSDGSIHRYSASTDQDEIDALAAAFAAAEVREARIEGIMSEEEIAGLLGDIIGSVKKVANIAKKVVTSKVFKYAATGIMAAAPALGPLAPVALAVGGSMHAASALTSAAIAAEGKARKVARKLTRAARRGTKKLSRKRGTRRKLLKLGNKRRKAALRMLKRRYRKKKPRDRRTRRQKAADLRAAKAQWAFKPTRKPRRTKAARKATARRKALKRQVDLVKAAKARRAAARSTPRRRVLPKLDVVKAAKAGKLRSNMAGAVSAKTLLEASRKGRVFWTA